MRRRSGVMLVVASLVLAIAGVAGTLAFADRGSDQPGQVAQAQEPGEDRGITVSGEGQVSVEPDTAKVVLGIESEGEELDALREDANTRMNDVIEALQDLGIEENDIRSVAYKISVREEEVPPKPEESQSATGSESGADGDDREAEQEAVEEETTHGDGEASASQRITETPTEPRITGYEIRQLVEVTVRDIDSTGDVIDTALDAGANNVSGVRFEVEDRDAAIEQARELAVEHAREKAEHLAELTGVSVGSPLYIDERSPSLPVERIEEAAMDADGGAGVSAPIQPGESTITVNVNIVYGIE